MTIIKPSESLYCEKKNVLILMPFRSGVHDGETASYLEKIRIKHIVEKLVKVKSKFHADTFIQYEANIINIGAGDIEEVVQEKFETTDLFIALLSQSNINVIYEVAILNVLQQNLILLKEEDISERNTPVYLRRYGYIPFYGGKKSPDGKIRTFIEDTSSDSGFNIYIDDENKQKKQEEFISLIESLDGRLKNKLENSIHKYEYAEVKPPLSFVKLVRDLHPSQALQTWNTLVPMCVLKASWKPVQNETTHYEGPESLIEEIHVTSCNNLFSRILGSAESNPEQFIKAEHPLTGSKQIQMFSRYISENNYLAFVEDQQRVFNELFIQNLPAKAKIPLDFRSGQERHPDPEFRNKVYLPVLISKKVVGVRASPHTTYYIITYIEDFFPLEENKTRKESAS